MILWKLLTEWSSMPKRIPSCFNHFYFTFSVAYRWVDIAKLKLWKHFTIKQSIVLIPIMNTPKHLKQILSKWVSTYPAHSRTKGIQVHFTKFRYKWYILPKSLNRYSFIGIESTLFSLTHLSLSNKIPLILVQITFRLLKSFTDLFNYRETPRQKIL